jgi:hypothetical protein
MALKFQITVDDKGNPAIEKLGKGAGKAEGAFGKLRTALNGFDKQIKMIGTAIAGFYAVNKIVNFAQAAIKAYDQQERAVKKLETALGGTSRALLSQASALQNVTRFGDEATIEAQALLATYQLSEKQIETLTPKILDMHRQRHGLGFGG